MNKPVNKWLLGILMVLLVLVAILLCGTLIPSRVPRL